MSKRQFRTFLVVMVALAAAFLALSAAEGAYAAQEPVTYVDKGGTPNQTADYTVLKGDETEIGTDEGTWYVVNKDTTFEKTLKVADGKKAKLLICKGVTMKCEDHLIVNKINDETISELAIYAEEKESGTLDVRAGWISGAAGLGGAENRSCGKIEICSGKVKVYREGMAMLHGGAAIGGGKNGDGGQIDIYGGNVEVQNKSSGTGIGGGHYGAAGDIRIFGGTVRARAGNYGAGIGSGSDAGDKNNNSHILISGGDVTAIAHSGGAGMGGGDHTPGGYIHITGGKVTASSARNSWIDCGAGIGGGNEANAGTIRIDGGYVDTSASGAGMGCGEDCKPDEDGYTGLIYINGGTVIAEAASGAESAGIGGSNEANGCHVIIRGGNVTAQGAGYNVLMMSSSNGGAGIGGGDNGSGGKTEIYGGTVKATGGYDGAGIGGGDHAKGGEILIAGGNVTATGKIGGSGIGGGEAQTSGNITITGGTVEATGGAHNSWSGSGIGGGDASSGSAAGETIRISGGTVTAKGGNESAGIGGGDDGGAGNVVIDGGTVNAYGGKYAAGIGTGQDPKDERRGDGSLIINGGQVTAYGGTDAAGIGGGETMSGIKATINGGTVYAEGKSYGAGIGGGEDSNGGDLTVNGGIVTAVAGDDCSASKEKGGSAIGCGQGVDKASSDAESGIFGKLTLSENAMVKVGDNVSGMQPVKADGRRSDLHWRNCAQILPCSHEGAKTFDRDENGHRIQGCSYCGLDQGEKEAHQYSEGLCRICGYEQPRTITVIFAAGDHGSGSMEPHMAYDGEKYALPGCGFDPASAEYEFAGWKVGDKSLKPEAEIEVTGDITVTAEWKEAGGNIWTGLESKLEEGSDALITLDSDVKATAQSDVLDVIRTVSLDLNGYTLDRNGKRGAALAIQGSGSSSGIGNLTLMNGTVIAGKSPAIGVNEGASLFLQDCTVCAEGYAGIRAEGGVSVAGRVCLIGTRDKDGDRDGGIYLIGGQRINIAGPLSADSDISVTASPLPTAERPVVLTSGLEGRGELKCFSSASDKYAIGENEEGEALLGIPTQISFDKGEGSEDEEHTMAAADGVCGGFYKLPQCSFIAPRDYTFKGWKVEGEEDDAARKAGERIKVSKDLKLIAVYEYAPETVTVRIDAGEGHEAIAQKIAEELNKAEADSATAEGTVVTTQMFEDVPVAKAEERICATLKKAGIQYDGEDGEFGNKWTKTVGLKQLKDYESIEAYRQAERQDTEGHGGERIDKLGRTFYVHWYAPIEEVALTIEEPLCGTEVKRGEDGKPDHTPGLKVTALPSDDLVSIQRDFWTINGGVEYFEGVMNGGEGYEAFSFVTPAFGYYFPPDMKVAVNGTAPGEKDSVTVLELMLRSIINIEATHEYGEDPTPTWEWTGYESATATFPCMRDESHKAVFKAEIIKDEEHSREATHNDLGRKVYTASVFLHKGDPQPYTDTVTQLLPKTDHEWGEADYTWAEDYSWTLAKRQCKLDPSHVETELVEPAGEVIKEATCTEAGTTRYTAAFESEGFSGQTAEAEDIPALGHDWGEWAETTPATESSEGVETRTCRRDGCGQTETRPIPALTHEHGLTHVPAKSATCTEDGCVEHWVCDQGDNPCGRSFADAKATEIIDDPVIPALGHDYQVEWKWSGDFSSAQLFYVCRNDSKDAGAIDADVTSEGSAATCEADGKILHTATVTDGPDAKTWTDVREEVVQATGHKWGKWQSMGQDQHQRVCQNDPNHVEKEAHDWDEGEVTVWPTTTSEGVRTFTCQTCQATKTETIDKLDPEDPIPFTGDMVALSAGTFTYNGSVQKPDVTVSFQGEMIEPKEYQITWSNENSVNAGTYKVTVQMKEGGIFSTDPVTRTYTIEKKELTGQDITVSDAKFVYNGSEQKPKIKVSVGGKTMTENRNYTLSWPEESVNAGDYAVTITGKGDCQGEAKVEYTIGKAANPMTVKAAVKKVKKKKVKKKKVNISAMIVRGQQGTVTYKGVGVNKKSKKTLKINAKTGKITVVKKAKKGTYKMKVTVRAAGNNNYNAKTQTVTVKVKVK